MNRRSCDIPSNSQQPNVEILVPQHLSAVPPLDVSVRRLRVYRSHGVAWRGLFPLLIESPSHICRRLLTLIFMSSQSSWDDAAHNGSGNVLVDEKDDPSGEASDQLRGFIRRSISLKNIPKCKILLHPPTILYLDTTFASVVLRTEHTMLRLQTMTAWLSTLGGGYYFCKRLNVSLQLARQQRFLALKMGNVSMARQCTVNEAYNLIYAGRFKEGKRVLRELEDSIIRSAQKKTVSGEQEDGSVTLRQCQAARLLAKRLKNVAIRGLKGYHTVEKGQKHAIDDYQRIRIVKD